MAIEISERIAPPGEQADLAVLASSERLQVLRALARDQGYLTVQALYEALDNGRKQPTLSYHLRMLREAGLIQRVCQPDQGLHTRHYVVCWRPLDAGRNELADLLSQCPVCDLATYVQHPEPEDHHDLWSLLFARPLRLSLLHLIAEQSGRLSVQELTRRLPPWSISTISQEVVWLHSIGLLVYKDADHHRYYRLNGRRLADLLHSFDLFRALERGKAHE
jgi:Fe2+ or Zn2+ uptake regulation protein